MEKLVVDGFEFRTKKEYEAAKKEYEAVEFLKAKTDMSKTDNVLKLYNKLVDKKTFSTILGYCFLKELRNRLVLDGKVEELFLIALPQREIVRENIKAVDKKETALYQSKYEDCMTRNKRMKLLCGVLVLIIAIMFVITATADYSPMIDYEKKIIDKYAAWEEELTEREEALQQKEEISSLNKAD